MNGMTPRLFLVALGAALLATVPGLHAQQTNADAEFVAPKPKKTKVDTAPVQKPSAADVSGVVKQAIQTPKAYQLINPLAPAKYGDGHDDVSWDPDNPEKPQGIILFGLQW